MLRVGVTSGTDELMAPVIDRLAELGAIVGEAGPPTLSDGGRVSVRRLADGGAGSFHFVIGVGSPDRDHRHVADLWIDDGAHWGQLRSVVDDLWGQRLVPFERNLRTGRRAPRRRQAVVVVPDPDWPAQARRLIDRLSIAIGGRASRIDHIGSTSVTGLPAKDLIDIQIVVADLDLAVTIADAGAVAGFVHVPGSWFGADREGRLHPEEVCVDADPGRPVNVNVRPVGAPVWRDTLLLRDWLRQDPDARAEYAALKHELAARLDANVDAYSDAKMPWIRAALVTAEEWAGGHGWAP